MRFITGAVHAHQDTTGANPINRVDEVCRSVCMLNEACTVSSRLADLDLSYISQCGSLQCLATEVYNKCSISGGIRGLHAMASLEISISAVEWFMHLVFQLELS